MPHCASNMTTPTLTLTLAGGGKRKLCNTRWYRRSLTLPLEGGGLGWG